MRRWISGLKIWKINVGTHNLILNAVRWKMYSYIGVVLKLHLLLFCHILVISIRCFVSYWQFSLLIQIKLCQRNEPSYKSTRKFSFPARVFCLENGMNVLYIITIICVYFDPLGSNNLLKLLVFSWVFLKTSCTQILKMLIHNKIQYWVSVLNNILHCCLLQ